MGSVCCCFCPEDAEENSNRDASIFKFCLCLKCLANVCTGIFRRQEDRVAPSPQGAHLALTGEAEDDSIPDTYRAPPRPLSYDDPRCSPVQHQRGLLSRRDKASSHCHEECEPLRGSNVDTDAESTGKIDKLCQSNYEVGAKSLKHPSVVMASGVAYSFSLEEDEDVCPTCLEEYTSENPKITMKCSHHFHLGCIYEWMERSEACPVCGKVMLFNEAT